MGSRPKPIIRDGPMAYKLKKCWPKRAEHSLKQLAAVASRSSEGHGKERGSWHRRR